MLLVLRRLVISFCFLHLLSFLRVFMDRLYIMDRLLKMVGRKGALCFYTKSDKVVSSHTAASNNKIQLAPSFQFLPPAPQKNRNDHDQNTKHWLLLKQNQLFYN